MENTIINNKEKTNGLSIFWIKIIAIISMTIDHVGFCLDTFGYENIDTLIYIFRCIGRLALPLFIFALVEGLMHTSNIKKYLLRLGICAFLVYIATLILQFGNISYLYIEGNIFMTLFMLALLYYSLKCCKSKLLAIVPILYFAASITVKIMYAFEIVEFDKIIAFQAFNGLLAQYDLTSLFLFIGIIIGYSIYDKKLAKTLANDQTQIDEFKASKNYQKSKNIIVSIIIAFITVVCYLITYLPSYGGSLIKISNFAIQTFMFLSIIPIMFYNGLLGRSNKVIKYGFYAYYPLHILIIYLIFYLINI